MLHLSELEQDALREFFNMGLGMAASELSQMVGREILLSLPHLDIVTQSEALSLLPTPSHEMVVAVRQEFHGALDGVALLIFPSANSLELVRELLNNDAPLETLSQLEQETLLDVGNIILNAFLSSFTQMLSFDFDFSQAEFLRVESPMLFQIANASLSPGLTLPPEEAPQRDRVFFLIMNFSTSEEENVGSSLRGYVVLLFSAAAMLTLQKELQRILSQFS